MRKKDAKQAACSPILDDEDAHAGKIENRLPTRSTRNRPAGKDSEDGAKTMLRSPDLFGWPVGGLQAVEPRDEGELQRRAVGLAGG